MKYLKMLALAAVAAMALMAFGAGTASATELYEQKTTVTPDKTVHKEELTVPKGTSIIASLETGTTASLASTAEDPIVTCTESSVEGSVSNAGGAAATVSGSVSHLTFSGSCSVTVDQTKNGTLEIHHIANTTNGTLTGTGFYVTVHSPFVGACNYGLAANTDLGTLTGSTSGKATMHINAIVTEQAPTRILCPDTTRWIAKYEVTSPDHLYVEAS